MADDQSDPPSAYTFDDLSGVDTSGVDISGIGIPVTPLSATDAAWQSFSMIGGYIGIILYIAIALRFVAFVTSDILHKPPPYRILVAVYTFIFAPLFIPYYAYRTFKAAWDIRKPVPVDTLPVAYSIFPAFEFDAREPYDLIKSLAGYPNRKDVLDSIQSRRAADDAARLSYLKDTAIAAGAGAAAGSSMVNSTLMSLLTGAGIVAVGYIVCVILYTIYQVLVPAPAAPPPPPPEPPICKAPPPRPLWWPIERAWPPPAPAMWPQNTPWPPVEPPENWPKGGEWPPRPIDGWPDDVSWPPLVGAPRPPSWPAILPWPLPKPKNNWPADVPWPLVLPPPPPSTLSTMFGGSSS